VVAGPQEIERFWDWWSKAEERLHEALEDPHGRVTTIDEIRFRLSKLKLDGAVLQTESGHLVVGSAGSDPDHRLIAAHWLVAAPSSQWFSFANYRPAQPLDRVMGSTLSGKPPVKIAELRFTHQWRGVDDLVDVGVYVGDGVSYDRAEQIAVIAVRSALGELDADAWIGNIAVLLDDPIESTDLIGLVASIELEAERRREPRWYTYQYKTPEGAPLSVMLRRPIQPVRHPFLDTCVAIGYQLQTEDPGEPERIQSQLLDGMPGDVLLVGSVLNDGWQTTLLYANGRSPTVARLRDRAAMLGAEFHATEDTSWWSVRRFQHVDPERGLQLEATDDPGAS